jgi:hypothetical protein
MAWARYCDEQGQKWGTSQEASHDPKRGCEQWIGNGALKPLNRQKTKEDETCDDSGKQADSDANYQECSREPECRWVADGEHDQQTGDRRDRNEWASGTEQRNGLPLHHGGEHYFDLAA